MRKSGSRSGYETTAPAQARGDDRIYVRNGTSGDLMGIDAAYFDVVAGVPASPDGKTIYVALSGTNPAQAGWKAGCGHDCPPHKTAARFDVVKNVQAGSGRWGVVTIGQ